MQINVSTRHGHLSPGTQEKIVAKVERLSRFYERVTGIEVTVDLGQKDQSFVEVRVSAERAADFVASHADGSVLAALDAVVDKVEQQLRKHKEKKVDRHRGGGRRHEHEPSWVADETEESP